MRPRISALALVGPGILIAATGVGAGDLLTASLAGSRHGLTLLWAAWIGALLKWFLNEGVARWQMATGTSLLQGWTDRLGQWIRWVFLGYLVIWTVFTGGALVNACGVAGTGIFPVTDDLKTSKIIWGVTHSVVGAGLVWLGGFKIFERLMGLFIAIMFVAVISAAALSNPGWADVGIGLVIPRVPSGGSTYMLGVLGGVGGTVTLLSYGYWIRQKGRTGEQGARDCRIDLGVGYAMTAIFGIAMIIIGSRTQLERGPTMALELAQQLGLSLGLTGKWVLLVGFWGAVFSSLLGVWQSIPYLFADFVVLSRGPHTSKTAATDLSSTGSYRAYLLLTTVASLPLLWLTVEHAQLTYAVLGSLFMPLLALTLLILNNRTDWVGQEFRNRWVTNIVLVTTLLFFGFMAVRTAILNLGRIL
ncbi:MAG: Nramp family divalent metal transporter [Gemmatimonadales bacterium]